MEAITSLRLRKISPASGRRWQAHSPIYRRDFPPRKESPTHAWTDEINRSRHEQRILTSRPYSAEQACFPCVEQIAKGFRKTSKSKKGETVYSITSCEPEKLNARQWLSALRTYWGIEAGVHQRLDVSAHEDLSRVRNENAVFVLGMFRRLGISIYAEWRSKSEKRSRTSLKTFHDAMSLNNQNGAYWLVFAKKPSLKKGDS